MIHAMSVTGAQEGERERGRGKGGGGGDGGKGEGKGRETAGSISAALTAAQ